MVHAGMRMGIMMTLEDSMLIHWIVANRNAIKFQGVMLYHGITMDDVDLRQQWQKQPRKGIGNATQKIVKINSVNFIDPKRKFNRPSDLVYFALKNYRYIGSGVHML